MDGGMRAGIERLARIWAGLGASALALLVAVTAYDVVAGKLAGKPLAGTYELAAILAGISIFAFFPYAQIKRAHVTVDLFMKYAGNRLNGLVMALSSLAFLILALFLVWRMTLGGIDIWRYGETTPILGLPLWWPYPIVLLSLLLWALSAFMCLLEDIKSFRGRR